MLKWTYKIIRSILFAVTLVVVGLYVVAYVLVSVPSFNNYIKNRASRELTTLFGSEVEIGNLRLSPFNEVVVEGLKVFDPQGEECLEVETVGAGISLWKLIYEQRIELTYGEIIGLKGNIIQEEEGGPLNIQFLIDALKSKDDKKEKKSFELALRNVVLRKSFLSFRRPWMENKMIGSLNMGNLEIGNINADITFPSISDRGVEANLRRLSFSVEGVTDIEKIALKGYFGIKGIDISDFEIMLPASRIFIPDIKLPLAENENFKNALENGQHSIIIKDSYLSPSDFSSLYAPLRTFDERLPLSVDISGNLDEIKIKDFELGYPSFMNVSFQALLKDIEKREETAGKISNMEIGINSSTLERLAVTLDNLPADVKEILRHAGNVAISGEASAEKSLNSFNGRLDLTSDLATLFVSGSLNKSKDDSAIEGEIEIERLALQKIKPQIPVQDLKGLVTINGGFNKKDPYGTANLEIDNFEYQHRGFEGFNLEVSKNGNDVEGSFHMDNLIGLVDSYFSASLSKEDKKGFLECNIADLNLSEVADMRKYHNYLISGDLKLNAEGSSLDDVEANFEMDNFSFKSADGSKAITLKKLVLASQGEGESRLVKLNSDWIDATLEGEIHYKYLPSQLTNLLADVFPALIHNKEINDEHLSDLDFQATIKPNNSVPVFFNLPFRLLVPVDLEGNISGATNGASLSIDLPYLQQGRDKLIYESRLFIDIDGNAGEIEGVLETTMPVKRGDLRLKLNLYGENNTLNTDINWENTENETFNGVLSIAGNVSRNPLTLKPEFMVDFKHSLLSMGDAEWTVNPAVISFSDNKITVEGLKIWHDKQFVEIEGTASPEYEDEIKIRLADIDVDYVFDMLQINYVTFGGVATGEITGHSLLSKEPVAETESLFIKNFSYNGAMIGDCNATSRWNNSEMEVEIGAEIFKEGHRRVKCEGGIWLKKDSLAFAINADKVPVEFIQPFMAVFSSHVGGFASGDINLFGTFKDIDMTGRIFADSVAVKLDYTNTVYHGSDSILLNPGQILIPSFRLFDKNGNTALLTGELTHRYFHDPSFTFRLSDASDFLCYDTNSDINPDWYGLLYGTGSALLKGVPGLVEISADMVISENSSFTFVLNDSQYAQDYQFLTFSDRKAEQLRALENKPVDFKELFKKKAEEDGSPSKFGIDIRASVTPAALFTLVMDPAAGDKITARGRGAMQVKYESDTDEMQMYGKYEIEEGNYNFSLQDIILRDFKIKEGSYISFNGNPLRADLDISAAYRVNTNLSDLDKSFSSDRDLTRTNVPVDAILSVTGNMQQPDITFDIELPTLTQDVERKVKSIISTDDMMNRQIIYLLALNRFYTPEYMGMSGNGGELAAVASSTISSQLSNILGQLTDKLSVAPSFRSDKGDFSDIEVDVALSSRLLNNRLLINGNFGYRDRSNSSTTFVGDFDVEYLLSKNGNLRLKAYNHFNDQNYYLREALTTQGLGIVFRKDFGDD